MTRLTLNFFFAAALLWATPWALAARPGSGVSSPAATAPGESHADDSLKKQLDDLCANRAEPLRVPKPFEPTAASLSDAAIVDGQPIKSEAEEKLQIGRAHV